MTIQSHLKSLADPKRAENYQRFFKTKKGEYGEGDVFLGIVVPELRKAAKEYKNLPLKDTIELLKSKFHEHRITALFILIHQYNESDDKTKKAIYDLYLKNTKHVNNWDLVDTSAEHIIGAYLADKDRTLLYKLAKSKDLWERRIAILSCFHYIKKNDFKDALKLSEILVNDKHDLMHKAVGWMLREIGKRDQEKEEKFLKKYYKTMPRTMLRYSIERFPESKRKFYMSK
jgi:3-methyladenine DNA glycosylase AlkD